MKNKTRQIQSSKPATQQALGLKNQETKQQLINRLLKKASLKGSCCGRCSI